MRQWLEPTLTFFFTIPNMQVILIAYSLFSLFGVVSVLSAHFKLLFTHVYATQAVF